MQLLSHRQHPPVQAFLQQLRYNLFSEIYIIALEMGGDQTSLTSRYLPMLFVNATLVFGILKRKV